MINQLRIYDLPKKNHGPLHDRFGDHATGIMEGYGLRTEAMWTDETDVRLRSVEPLAWHERAEMEARWNAFMADEERERIRRVTAANHGTLVNGIDEIVREPVAVSRGIGDLS